jgi:intracellular sulfur oxidation DsrE/DsrF family protein
VVVAHGPGIDFLLDGAKDKNGNPFDAVVQELVNRNVQFRVCYNMLETRKIDRKHAIPEAPFDVAEVSRLQLHEGHDYIYLNFLSLLDIIRIMSYFMAGELYF